MVEKKSIVEMLSVAVLSIGGVTATSYMIPQHMMIVKADDVSTVKLDKDYDATVIDTQNQTNKDNLDRLDKDLFAVEVKRQFGTDQIPDKQQLTIKVMQPSGLNSAMSKAYEFKVSSEDQFNEVMNQLMKYGYTPGVYEHQNSKGDVEYTGLMLHDPTINLYIKDSKTGKVLSQKAVYPNAKASSDKTLNMLTSLNGTTQAGYTLEPTQTMDYKDIGYTYTKDGKTYGGTYVSSNETPYIYGLDNDGSSQNPLDSKNNAFAELFLRSYDVNVSTTQEEVVASSSSEDVNSETPSSATSSDDGKDVPLTSSSSSKVDASSTTDSSSSSNDQTESKVDSSSVSNESNQDSSNQSDASVSESSVKQSSKSDAKNDDQGSSNTESDKADTVKSSSLKSSVKAESSSKQVAVALGTNADDNNGNDDTNGNTQNNDTKDTTSESSVTSKSSSANDGQGGGASDEDGLYSSNGDDSSYSEESEPSSSSSEVSSSSSSEMPQTGEVIAKHPFMTALCALGIIGAGGFGLYMMNRKKK